MGHWLEIRGNFLLMKLDRKWIVMDLDHGIKDLQRHTRIAHSHGNQLAAELVSLSPVNFENSFDTALSQENEIFIE